MRLIQSMTLVAAVLAAVTVHADTIYVCWDGSGDYLTIQEGIDAAEDGDEVVVCDGTYTGLGNKDLDFGGKAITVRSENGPDNCIIDCENDGRGFYFRSGEDLTSALLGLTVRNGKTADGGAVLCDGASPYIADCVLTQNKAEDTPDSNETATGGALSCRGGAEPILSRCTISLNSALAARYAYGGAVHCHNSNPSLEDCIITQNLAQSGSRAYGGGVYCLYSNPLVASCDVSYNAARVNGSGWTYGGGVYCRYSSPTLTSCFINANQAVNSYVAHGGGIYCEDQSSPAISTCTINMNLAEGGGQLANGGGGVYCEDQSRPTIADSEISGNSAICLNGGGGAIQCYDHGEPSVTRCTISENFASGHGAGVYCDHLSGATFTECTIDFNVAERSGGGLYFNSNSPASMANCTVAANDAESGGGVFCDSSDMTLESCAIEWNRANVGGGMYIVDSIPTMEGCKLSANTAHGVPGGGGLYCVSSRIIANHCTIVGNATNAPGASGGGALITSESSYRLANSLMLDNRAYRFGGGLFIKDSRADLTNCTMGGNRAGIGGAVHARRATTLTLANSILWRGDAALGPEIAATGEYDRFATISVSHSLVKGGGGMAFVEYGCTLNWQDGNLRVDPGLAFNDDYHLLVESPCVDECASALEGSDLDGNLRALDGDGNGDVRTDFGAYEFNRGSPSIALFPSAVEFFGEFDGPSPEPHIVSIRNCGGDLLNWELTEGADWVDASPESGTSAGEIDEIALTVDTTGLAKGTYTCTLLAIDEDAVNSPREIQVTLHVRDVLHVPAEFATIQAAINTAADHDVVLLADGIYTGQGNKDLDFAGRSITVRSASGNPQACIIDCEGGGRGFWFHSGEGPTAKVEGLTITNGAAFDGAGILCSDASSPTISNCAIIGNAASNAGGGVWLNGSDAVLADCLISDNTAENNAGGIACYYGSPALKDCVISRNTANPLSEFYGFGGGVHCSHANVRLQRCLLVENMAKHGGGVHSEAGYYTYPAVLHIEECTIAANSAGRNGGGIWTTKTHLYLVRSQVLGNSGNYGGGINCLTLTGGDTQHVSLFMYDCLVSGNQAAECAGGVLRSSNVTGVITNCTVAYNTAGVLGGGMWFRFDESWVRNCVFWGNTAPDGPQIACGGDVDSRLWVDYSVVQGGQEGVWDDPEGSLVWGDGNLDADPLFVDADGPDDDPETWEDNDFHLGTGSPCIDAATSDGAIPIDKDGNPRCDDLDTPNMGGGDPAYYDIGAYEYAGNCCFPPEVWRDPMSQAVCIGDPVTFGVAIEGAEPLSYQWRKDGEDIPGATGDSYTIESVLPDDGGSYDVIVTNSCGSAASDAALLTVLGPEFLSHPVDQTVHVGDLVVFRVSVQGYGYTLAYQWRKDGQDLTDDGRIIGSETHQLVIVSAELGDAGVYDCVVRQVESGCWATSDPATLTVLSDGCIGDLDGDGDTDHSDLGILLADWGCVGSEPGDCPGDLDGDFDTDHSDLGILLADWGCGT